MEKQHYVHPSKTNLKTLNTRDGAHWRAPHSSQRTDGPSPEATRTKCYSNTDSSMEWRSKRDMDCASEEETAKK